MKNIYLMSTLMNMTTLFNLRTKPASELFIKPRKS